MKYADELLEHIEDMASNEPYISQTDRNTEIRSVSDFLARVFHYLILPNYQPDLEDDTYTVFI